MLLTLVLTLPETLSISPRKADTKELFPEPTVPTTATNWLDVILKLMFFNIGASADSSQVNVPFSITRGSSKKVLEKVLNYILKIIYFVILSSES